MTAQTPFHTCLLVNLLAAVCVAILIGLGVYVTKVPLLVGGVSTSGFNVIQANQSSWNVGCTVIGTAVGLVLTWGFASHDDLLTRSGLLTRTGVLAIYLRPLSALRGLQQIGRGRFPPIRSFLILASIVSTLTSTATVAIFGIHTESIEVINPLASYPIAALNDEYYAAGQGQSSFPIVEQYTDQVPALSAFLYRDSYIRSLQTLGKYNPGNRALQITDSGSIGDTIYPGLNTSGIGLNTTSYTQFYGLSYGYNLPTSYTFEQLDAAVFATNVSVSCSNATGSYNVATTQNVGLGYVVSVYSVWKDNFPNTTFIQDTSYGSSLSITSVVTEQNGEPLHTFIFPGDFGPPFILECTYGGNEFLASISLLDRVSPFLMNGVIDQGPALNTSVKWNLSNITHDYIYYYSHGTPGGSIADGWVSSEYDAYVYSNNTSTAELMSTIVGELGQAYYSLLRQQIEIADQVRGQNEMYDNGSFVKMMVAVLRVGGASYAWLAIYGLMFVGAMLGTVMASLKKQVLLWEAQDPVALLKKCLPEYTIDEVTQLRYGVQFEVVGSNDTKEPSKQDQPGASTSLIGEEVTEQEV